MKVPRPAGLALCRGLHGADVLIGDGETATSPVDRLSEPTLPSCYFVVTDRPSCVRLWQNGEAAMSFFGGGSIGPDVRAEHSSARLVHRTGANPSPMGWLSRRARMNRWIKVPARK